MIIYNFLISGFSIFFFLIKLQIFKNHLTFLLYGLLITNLVSSEPDKIYSPVSFQQIVLT